MEDFVSSAESDAPTTLRGGLSPGGLGVGTDRTDGTNGKTLGTNTGHAQTENVVDTVHITQLPAGSPPVGGGRGTGGEMGDRTRSSDADNQTSITYKDSDAQTVTPYLSFSPKTCLQLVNKLTKEQTEYETNYFRSLLGSRFGNTEAHKSPASISRNLAKQLLLDTDRIVNNLSDYDKLTENFFILVTEAEKLLLDYKSRDQTSHSPDPLVDLNLDSEPVSFLDCSINSNISECIEGVTFKTVGNREVDYFGTLPYQY